MSEPLLHHVRMAPPPAVHPQGGCPCSRRPSAASAGIARSCWRCNLQERGDDRTDTGMGNPAERPLQGRRSRVRRTGASPYRPTEAVPHSTRSGLEHRKEKGCYPTTLTLDSRTDRGIAPVTERFLIAVDEP